MSLRVRGQVVALLLGHQEDDRDQERAGHRDHLAPGVDAPPEPAKDVEEAGPGADLQDQVEAVLGRGHQVHHAGRAHEEADRREPARRDVVVLALARPQEALVEVVDEVRGAPVEVRQDRRRVRGDQAADHQPHPADRQDLADHRGVGDVVPHPLGVEVREGRADVGELREDDERAEADQDPGPGPQHVVRDVEEEDAAERVALRARGEHALRDVAAAAGLGARVPDGPPLHGDRHDEDGHGEVPEAGVVRRERPAARSGS